MNLRDIILWPDPRLSETCAPVAEITPEVRWLAGDMLETMYQAPGRGLAAPQVGILMRLFVMDTQWKDGQPAPQVFVNPEIVTHSDACVTSTEGCLSLPGIKADVERPAEVRLSWTDLDGAHHDEGFQGFDAACVQHEMDHLDGVLTLDRVNPVDRERLVAEYERLLA